MGSRIRSWTLTVGASVSNLESCRWSDNDLTFDRSQADDERHGTPVQMKEGGSGTVVLLAGSIARGYQTSNWVITHNEISVSAGVESKVTKSWTFTDVTTQVGADIKAGEPGKVNIEFTYGSVTGPT